MGIVVKLVDSIRNHLIVVIPFSILLIQFLVRFLTREEPKQLFVGTLLSFPSELLYIAMSFVLSALARIIPRFSERFGPDPTRVDLAGAVLMLGLLVAATVVAYLVKWTKIFGQKWYVAQGQVWTMINEPGFDWSSPGFAVAGRMAWILIYWVGMIFMLSAGMFISVGCLRLVLHLIV